MISCSPSRDAAKARECVAYVNAFTGHSQFPKSAFMRADALFDDGEDLTDFAMRLQIAQQNHRIGEVTHIDLGLHAVYQAMLCVDEKCDNTFLIQIGDELMQMQVKILLPRHRHKKPIQAVDHHYARVFGFDVSSDLPCKLTGREFGGVNPRHGGRSPRELAGVP